VTVRHLDNMNKIILATGCMVGYAYAVEFFTAGTAAAVTSCSPSSTVPSVRMPGPTGRWSPATFVIPQLLWFKYFRTTPWAMWIIAVLVNVGMWFERFVIIITSLTRDYLPSSWGMYMPTWVDLCMLAGSFGLFSPCFCCFAGTCRWSPWRR